MRASSLLLLILSHLLLALLAMGGEDKPDQPEAVLGNAGIGLSDKDLIGFFTSRRFSKPDLSAIPRLITLLGDEEYQQRENASKTLRILGWHAQTALKNNLSTTTDPEIAQRIARLIEENESQVALAAAKLIVQRQIPNIPALLLGYLPACPDADVRNQLTQIIFLNSLSNNKVDQALIEGLHDEDPIRRATSAVILTRVSPDSIPSVRKLMEDPSLTVKNAVARTLFELGDQEAVPCLIALIRELPAKEAFEIEDILFRVAGAEAVKSYLPAIPDTETRAVVANQWKEWWEGNRNTIDLSRRLREIEERGDRVVCELTGGSQNQGRIVCFARDNSIRWQFDNLQGPMDVQKLQDGHLLVAEIFTNRITERDQTGRILWEHKTDDSPMSVQKLRNGNVLFTTYSRVREISPDHKTVFLLDQPGKRMFSAQKLRNGNILLINDSNKLVEINSEGKEIANIPCGDTSNWGSFEILPNGHFLVCRCSRHEVVEIDRQGKVYWRIETDWPTWASQRSNGNIVVACANTGLISEWGRNGKLVWKQTLNNRPSRMRVY